jgi:hypothetical protein
MMRAVSRRAFEMSLSGGVCAESEKRGETCDGG